MVATETKPATATPASQVENKPHNPLRNFFNPHRVAVIGASATPNAVGRTLFWNLLKSPFGGVVYPVNPKRDNILGVRAYSSVATIPDPIDLAVICTPAASVPDIIKECADADIPAAVVISAGFKEMGPPGIALEKQILDYARPTGMRIIGPNCLGLMNPIIGLNATFAATIARPGSVAFISQSGALCTAILDWSLTEQVGFSAFVSLGSMLDISWGDLIDTLGDDPNTNAILIYMESVGDAPKFLAAAKKVAPKKPIIVIKAGRSDAAAKAAASHTGSMTGSDAVLDAAFRASGVLRVDRISDLFYMAEVLARQPLPKGNRLAVVTNAGGPGVLATDALIAGHGALADLAPQTVDTLNATLPPQWSRNNPVDILGDAGAKRYADAVHTVAADPTSDGLLVILTPQDMTDPTATAAAITDLAHSTNKPILASWMGGPAIKEGEHLLNKAGIPTFPYPDTAAMAFNYLARHAANLQTLEEAKRAEALAPAFSPNKPIAASIIRQARSHDRTILTEVESKHLLHSYNIPVTLTLVSKTPEQAAAHAEKLGFPVVVKLHSQTITHKTEVNGVQLNIKSPAEVKAAFAAIKQAVTERASADDFLGVTVQPMVSAKNAYELIAGSTHDPQFGPVIAFGAGGQLVEILSDAALALPPLNQHLALGLINQTKIAKALHGTRGRPPVNLDQLTDLLIGLSQLVIAHPDIKEIDMNPILATPEKIIALDARVILHPAG